MTMTKKLKGAALQPDASIASVADGLKHAEEYVRKVFLGMSKHRDWRVRIATAGGSEAPDYLFDQFAVTDVGPQQPVLAGAFSGTTHRPLLVLGPMLRPGLLPPCRGGRFRRCSADYAAVECPYETQIGPAAENDLAQYSHWLCSSARGGRPGHPGWKPARIHGSLPP